jgi:hypothetical protein
VSLVSSHLFYLVLQVKSPSGIIGVIDRFGVVLSGLKFPISCFGAVLLLVERIISIISFLIDKISDVFLLMLPVGWSPFLHEGSFRTTEVAAWFG